MRSVVALAPSRPARIVLVPEVLPADDEGREPAAMPLRTPRPARALLAAVVVEYAGAPTTRRGDLLDVYC